jgi:hypothetical protein
LQRSGPFSSASAASASTATRPSPSSWRMAASIGRKKGVQKEFQCFCRQGWAVFAVG